MRNFADGWSMEARARHINRAAIVIVHRGIIRPLRMPQFLDWLAKHL